LTEKGILSNFGEIFQLFRSFFLRSPTNGVFFTLKFFYIDFIKEIDFFGEVYTSFLP